MKAKSIRGLLINPASRTCIPVDIPLDKRGSCLAGLRLIVGCARIERLPIGNKNDLLFDEEALLHEEEDHHYFVYVDDDGTHWLIGGRAIIVGLCPDESDWIDYHPTDVRTIWLTREQGIELAHHELERPVIIDDDAVQTDHGNTFERRV